MGCEMMLQEELEHCYLCEFAGRGRNSLELVPFFQGEIRKFLRWADYTMIATTTLVSEHVLALRITITDRLSGFAYHDMMATVFHAVSIKST